MRRFQFVWGKIDVVAELEETPGERIQRLEAMLRFLWQCLRSDRWPRSDFDDAKRIAKLRTNASGLFKENLGAAVENARLEKTVVELFMALVISRADWIHSVNAKRCWAAVALVDPTFPPIPTRAKEGG